MQPSSARYPFLDELRALSLFSMILYHFCWNLDHLFGVSLPWYHQAGAQFWQFTICGTFLVLTGACAHLTHHPVQRILRTGAAALLVTLVTLFTGSQTLIVFGILHCMTLCLIIQTLAEPLLRRIPTLPGLLLSAGAAALTYHIPQQYLGFAPFTIALPQEWYVSYWLSILGLLSPDFRSADYFPIFPYLFVFLVGYFAGRLLPRLSDWSHTVHCRPLAWVGRHSLLLYLLHQPVLYGAMTLFFILLRR